MYSLIFAGAAASAVYGAACSGDNGGTGATGDDGGSEAGLEAGPGVDSSFSLDGPGLAPDSSTHDTGTVTVDSGTADSGQTDSGGGDDSGQTDSGSGQDSGGDDSGQADSGQDSGGDGGGQTEAGDDGGGDASDGNVADTGTDSQTVSFTNPVQIDVSSLLNANTVVGTAVGGVARAPMDGNADTGADNNFPTQAEALVLNAAGVGLPDTAFFKSTGATIPDVQLWWTNAMNQRNSLLVTGTNTPSAPFSFPVPAGNYSQAQLYATGGAGPGTLSVTLTYATGAPTTSSVTVPDWCGAPVGPGEYKLISVDRVQHGTVFSPNPMCGIFAIDLNPDSARALNQISFTYTSGTATHYLVFYGATAW